MFASAKMTMAKMDKHINHTKLHRSANPFEKKSGNNPMRRFAFFTLFVPKNPFMFGFGSIFNISGRYVRMNGYLDGSDLSDIGNDWKAVGSDFYQPLLRRF